MTDLPDYKQAALNMYPEEWQEFEGFFRVDHNANIRAVAEDVFKRVFEQLTFDEELHYSVASAFKQRVERFSMGGNDEDAAFMATALQFAIIKIRDNKEQLK